MDDEAYDKLLDRLETALIRARDAEDRANKLENERRDLNLAHTEKVNALRSAMHHYEGELANWRQPRDPDSYVYVAHENEELHRVMTDAHSLFDREDLTETEKLKSVHGLIDQVLNKDWLAATAKAAPKRKTRAAKQAPDDSEAEALRTALDTLSTIRDLVARENIPDEAKVKSIRHVLASAPLMAVVDSDARIDEALAAEDAFDEEERNDEDAREFNRDY